MPVEIKCTQLRMQIRISNLIGDTISSHPSWERTNRSRVEGSVQIGGIELPVEIRGTQLRIQIRISDLIGDTTLHVRAACLRPSGEVDGRRGGII